MPWPTPFVGRGEATGRMKKSPAVASAAGLVGTVLAVHLALLPRIAGPDAFYHMGHARLYLHRGLFDTSFPWATQSLIRDMGADLWWGFHMALLPFALIPDVAMGIRIAALTLTFLFAGTAFWVLRRHRVPGAAWWAVGLLVAVPNVLFRLVMVRPHVLSLALALLLLSFLARGRWWQVLLTSTAIVWLHLALFWMAPGIVAAYALARIFVRRAERDPGVPLGRAIAAVLVGTALGWALRPHPLASAQLVWVQIVRLFTEKASGVPLTFGVELLPLPLRELLAMSWSFLLLWVATLAVLAVATVRRLRRRSPPSAGDFIPAGPERTLLVTSLFCSSAFLGLTVLSARRALVGFVVFGFLAVPLVWGRMRAGRGRRITVVALAVLLVVHVPWAVRRDLLNVRLVASPPDLLEDAADWLAANTEPGDIVFHLHWDDFGPLFAWNRSNRYLGGMDPIFQFAHDPAHYWEFFFLSEDLTTRYTCDAFPCSAGRAIDTPTAITRDFGARWVLVEPSRNPKLTRYFIQDDHFELALETRHEAVFRVLPDPSIP